MTQRMVDIAPVTVSAVRLAVVRQRSRSRAARAVVYCTALWLGIAAPAPH